MRTCAAAMNRRPTALLGRIGKIQNMPAFLAVGLRVFGLQNAGNDDHSAGTCGHDFAEVV